MIPIFSKKNADALQYCAVHGWLHSSFHDLNDFIILHFVRLFPSVHSWLLSVTQSYHLLIKFEEESLALDLMQ